MEWDALRIIKHAVCKLIIPCNATAGLRENEVSSICVCHQDHITRMITDSCVWVGGCIIWGLIAFIYFFLSWCRLAGGYLFEGWENGWV